MLVDGIWFKWARTRWPGSDWLADQDDGFLAAYVRAGNGFAAGQLRAWVDAEVVLGERIYRVSSLSLPPDEKPSQRQALRRLQQSELDEVALGGQALGRRQRGDHANLVAHRRVVEFQ